MSNTAIGELSTGDHDTEGLPHLAGKYLAFALGNERYGLEILKVQEIIGVIRVTEVPQAPHYIKGVINLRGKIIPVIDLRRKLGMEERAYDEKTCFIVVNTVLQGRALAVGVVVDTVLEVLNFETKHIQHAPQYGTTVDTDFILGLGKINEQVVILINIDVALNDDAGSLSSF